MGETIKKVALVQPQGVEYRNREQLKLRFLDQKKIKRNGVRPCSAWMKNITN